eukprot:3626468-Amphidinium_carterae.1
MKTFASPRTKTKLPTINSGKRSLHLQNECTLCSVHDVNEREEPSDHNQEEEVLKPRLDE